MDKLNLTNIDDIFNSKFRMAIMALLSSGDEFDFAYFKSELEISDGNLSSHMNKLEKAEFVIIKKFIQNKKPKTMYRISPKGLRQYKAWLKEIAKLLQ